MIALSSFSGLPVVLKFLKFHRCPEIVLKLEIVLKFYSFGQNVLKLTFVMLLLCCRNGIAILYTFFTSHDYDYVGDIEYQVMFSLVTF